MMRGLWDVLPAKLPAINWKIDTYEGRYIVTENDWIIKDSLGRFSICNNHIFTHLYDVFE